MATPSRRAWGWHQLSPEWAARLVAGAAVHRGDLVLDVGAGRGVVTAALLASGARVIAIEAHPERAAHLRRRFGDEVTVVRADAADLRLPRRPFSVVANPPFGITTPLLRRLLSSGGRLVAAHLVLQDQAARRWAAPDAPGRRRWGVDHTVALGPAVPRRAFTPPPRVAARVLVVTGPLAPAGGRRR